MPFSTQVTLPQGTAFQNVALCFHVSRLASVGGCGVALVVWVRVMSSYRVTPSLPT